MNTPDFKTSLKRQVVDTIGKMKRDGLVSASPDCIYQNMRLGPLSLMQDAPRGANAGWQVRQIFNDLLVEMPLLRSFAKD